jgi:hypothetical protein
MQVVIRFGDDAPLLSYIVYNQEYTRLSTLETGMKRCRVKKFVTSTGEEMAILRTADGSPAFWPNLLRLGSFAAPAYPQKRPAAFSDPLAWQKIGLPLAARISATDREDRGEIYVQAESYCKFADRGHQGHIRSPAAYRGDADGNWANISTQRDQKCQAAGNCGGTFGYTHISGVTYPHRS